MSDYEKLKRDATVVMQARLRAVLKEIVADERVNESCVREVEAIHKIWSLYDLTWVREEQDAS